MVGAWREASPGAGRCGDISKRVVKVLYVGITWVPLPQRVVQFSAHPEEGGLRTAVDAQRSTAVAESCL